MPPLTSPHRVADPYYTLGTHPDVVARLWEELARALPVDCRAVLYGVPALIHPETGVVFGFAGGTHTYALRLPDVERRAATRVGAACVRTYSDGSTLDLTELGFGWVFCGWFGDEQSWCLAAFEHAGSAI